MRSVPPSGGKQTLPLDSVVVKPEGLAVAVDGGADVGGADADVILTPLKVPKGILEAGCVVYAQSVVPSRVRTGAVVPPQLQ